MALEFLSEPQYAALHMAPFWDKEVNVFVRRALARKRLIRRRAICTNVKHARAWYLTARGRVVRNNGGLLKKEKV